MLILGGFFALTVGAVALRGLTTLEGGQTGVAVDDLRDSATQAIGLTIGLVVGTLVTHVRPTRGARSP